MTGASSEAMHELLGAYALDAVEPDEAAALAELVERDPLARAEFDELLATAAWIAHLADDDLAPAPAALWDRIEAHLAPAPAAPAAPPLAIDGSPAMERTSAPAFASGAREEPDASASPAPVASLDARRRRNRWIAPLAVAACLAIGAAAAVVVRGSDGPAPADVVAAAEAALADDAARTVALTESGATDEPVFAAVALYDDGTGYLVSERMPDLTADRTYQLWALVGDPSEPTVISAGVLGPRPDAATFTVDGPVVGFVVTEEVAGGVVSSSNPAKWQGLLA